MAPPEKTEEMKSNIILYQRRLDKFEEDISALSTFTEKVKTDRTTKHLFLAQLNFAKSTFQDYNVAWDKLEACFIKSGDLTGFPSQPAKIQRGKLLDIINQAEALRLSLEETCPTSTLPNNSTTFFESRSKSFLPPIKLPLFSGNIQSWAFFRDTFTSLVDSDPSLKPVEKLHHLLSSLSGEALARVKHFQITDDNYPLVWSALNKAYDNKRVLAHSYLDKILNFHFNKSATVLSNLLGFTTNVADSVSSFKSLNLENPDDVILSYLALRTLDSTTRQKFELDQLGKSFPSVDDLINFIRNGYQALRLSSDENLNQDRTSSSSAPSTKRNNPRFPSRSSPRYETTFLSSGGDVNSSSCHKATPRSSVTYIHNSLKTSSPKSNSASPKASDGSSSPCPFCQGHHSLLSCCSFAQLTAAERRDFISKWKGCHNCLRSSHPTKDCRSKLSCRYCKERHHSLVHVFNGETSAVAVSQLTEDQSVHHTHDEPLNNLVGFSYYSPLNQVLLGTALVLIEDRSKKTLPIRALLDTGSTRSYITLNFARRLKLPIFKTAQRINVFAGKIPITVSGLTQCIIRSKHRPDVNIPLCALVTPSITSHLPLRPLPEHILKFFSSFQLADPNFGAPQGIDLLLGYDVMNLIITGLPRLVKEGYPWLTSTIFGDTVTGPISYDSLSQESTFLVSSPMEIQDQLKQFWSLEESSSASLISPEDEYCEQHFIKTYSRTSSGRFVVRFPFQGEPDLGDNRNQVKNRLLHLERKFSMDPQLFNEYSDFLRQYSELGHMSKATQKSSYLIPHHAVHKGGKIRVVFDGSCTSSTSSINSQLLSGPKLQADVGDILLRFRFHRIAIVTDIVKMYRQILIHPDERIFQHILWREHPSEEIQEFALNTVTYGLRSSAFQAIRSVKELAKLEVSRFPQASQCILRDMFVDDLVTGAQSADEARSLCQELIDCFACGGFDLDKWSSNKPEILPDSISSSNTRVAIEPEETPSIKVLGLIWDPQNDTFAYSVSSPSKISTKRAVLSTIAKIFDPLGFLAPVVLKAKLFLQSLWLLNIDWDTSLPQPLNEHWSRFTSTWECLTHISIPRFVPYHDAYRTDLIGFCDASSKAYSAVFYLRTQTCSGEVTVSLLKAKTKVAPTKFHSISRLELCGALLLSNLFSSIQFDPLPNPSQVYFFTDSAVVLAWLRTPSHQLTVFEANRVTTIQEKTSIGDWYHVKSAENPADVASRGLNPSEINDSVLWWNGPSWLRSSVPEWPISKSISCFPPSEVTFHTTTVPQEPEWIRRFSKLQNLIRTVVRIVRLSTYIKSFHSPAKRQVQISSPIAFQDISDAFNRCLRMVQHCAYPTGIRSSNLTSLVPFSDEHGILRVGGRLHNAPVSKSFRHPVILPPQSHLTYLIVSDVHERHFHSGANLTLSLLRAKYWLPSGLRYIKGLIQRCVTCRRRRPKPETPLMAPLPASRFDQIRPFLQVGIDFAGPFLLRDSLRRKPNISKCYLCLFVCFSTKALHLEAVTSLSTESFLATLDRFISRRGIPKAIHTDNATNFVGASRYLKDIYSFVTKQSPQIQIHLAHKGIDWHFIPPRSPHFGGLWEAGVKAVKRLLPSSVGSHPMTYEELSTVFVKIEAILNSRPLCPINEDPETLDILTPGHFLIGCSLEALPSDDLTHLPISRLSRWQLVENQVQHIWQRWSREYLHHLQQRHKWNKSNATLLSPGDVVVLLETKTPLGQWPLARIVQTHPGADGVVRVVTIRTPSGAELKRSVSSLSLLFSPSSKA